jgi:integrase
LQGRAEATRRIFLLQLYTGQRVSDIFTIEPHEIQYNKQRRVYLWTHVQKKTGKQVVIPLTDPAVKLLKPFGLSETTHFAKGRFLSISQSGYQMSVSAMCTQAGLVDYVPVYRDGISIERVKSTLVTSHTARRTFITQSLLRGVPPHVVMAITGHTNFASFQKYIRFIQRETESRILEAWSNEDSNLNEKKIRLAVG